MEMLPGKKRGRKPRDSSPKPQKRLKIKDAVVVDSDFPKKKKNRKSKSKVMEKLVDEEEDENVDAAGDVVAALPFKKTRKVSTSNNHQSCRLTGLPIDIDRAEQLWPYRYHKSKARGDTCRVSRQYMSAEIDGVSLELNDFCLIKAANEPDYIGRILEFFETRQNKPYISVKWFSRAEDTVIRKNSNQINAKCVFATDTKENHPLECVISKITVVQSPEDVEGCDFYYDMFYDEEFCTFKNLHIEYKHDTASSSSVSPGECSSSTSPSQCCSKVVNEACESEKPVMTALDMYAGCGGMSTGLCMGAAAANINIVSRWALDYNEDACNSFRHNHPETEVRHGKAEHFLALLRKWLDLCQFFKLLGTPYSKTKVEGNEKHDANKDAEDNCHADDEEDVNKDYEVERIVDICFGDPNSKGEPGLHYLVKWKGFGPASNLWLPDSAMEDCQECVQEFVTEGYRAHILPLPETVDIVCGGPPCQGMSGFNRYRNSKKPLEDDKNFQLEVFLETVNFLRPKFVLMENVVDILKLKEGFLGRFTVAKMVAMKYQVRLGLLAAGNYGLPQYRQRAFFWGAKTTETLPQFPLPTHDVIGRGVTPKEFKRNLVSNDPNVLKPALTLGDAISDLPVIFNDETRDEMEYVEGPNSEFQRKIRLPKHEFMVSGCSPQSSNSGKQMLYDHRSLNLNENDYTRVSLIPHEKGANYRDLPWVIVVNNVARHDPNKPKIYIGVGRRRSLLVPNYALKYEKGKSTKPFGRLWMDEVVNTVVTRAEPHNQAILHPKQDRVLSIRENARLQGFPDWYRLFGDVKERYKQIGNAVAVPVAKALGFALGMAVQKTSDGGHVVALPPDFSR